MDTAAPSAPEAAWPFARGEMAQQVLHHDWAATPLGPISDWSTRLRMAVEQMLASQQPVYIAWGSRLTSLYNDGYIPLLGGKHPAALAQPYAAVWPEIWDEYRPIAEATMTGQPHFFVDRPVALLGRAGRPLS